MPRYRKPRKSRMSPNKPKLPYRSLFEELVARRLQDEGSGARYEEEKLPYIVEGNYVPDWTLPNNVIIEAKGVLDVGTRKKMLAVQRANPHRTICIVFQRASNKISKASKTTYGEWAEANGFLWSDQWPDPSWYKLPKGPRRLGDKVSKPRPKREVVRKKNQIKIVERE